MAAKLISTDTLARFWTKVKDYVDNSSGGIAVPTKVSDLQNDLGFITSESDPNVPSWAKASTKPSYTASEVGALPDSTTIPSLPADVGITASTTDLTAGTSTLTTGTVYLVYE